MTKRLRWKHEEHEGSRRGECLRGLPFVVFVELRVFVIQTPPRSRHLPNRQLRQCYDPILHVFSRPGRPRNRTITLHGRAGLPDGEYGLVEFYCDEPDCDCRRVIFRVVSAPPDMRTYATINYGWESLEFYAGWMHGDVETAAEMQGASLEPFGPQSQYSAAFLELVKWALQDEAYVSRLQEHYRLLKAACGVAPAGKEPRFPPRCVQSGRQPGVADGDGGLADLHRAPAMGACRKLPGCLCCDVGGPEIHVVRQARPRRDVSAGGPLTRSASATWPQASWHGAEPLT